MIGDTGCCGFNTHEKGPTVVGVLTLSLPMLIVCVLVYPVLWLVGVLVSPVRRLCEQVGVIIRANTRLIHQTKFIPLYRCRLAGGLFKLSPRVSGWVYRHFNLTVFSVMWIALMIPIIVLFRS